MSKRNYPIFVAYLVGLLVLMTGENSVIPVLPFFQSWFAYWALWWGLTAFLGGLAIVNIVRRRIDPKTGALVPATS